MSKTVGKILQIAALVVSVASGFGAIGVAASRIISAGIGLAMMLNSALMGGKGGQARQASIATLSLGEVPREAIFGRSLTGGSLVDAFNYGGKYGTDWEVMVVALADHKCAGLVGFYVNDAYVAYSGDGAVGGYNGQLEIYFRPGTETQSVPSILTAHGPGWTANDNGAGVCWVAVAYKADKSDAKNPIWPAGRPRFSFVVDGLLCYQARKDSTVAGGSGAHRWADPATREWTDNPIDIRHTYSRGIYACDRVDQPDQLLIGRGLDATQAPPENVAWRANLCDELVALDAGGTEKRYTVNGVVRADETFLSVDEKFAMACGGIITQPEGCVEIEPGHAKSPVAYFTDLDLVTNSRVSVSKILTDESAEWVNTVIPRYIEPAQKYADLAAPIRRLVTDIQSDRKPRELTLSMPFVHRSTQAGRVGEIWRRLGRLWARGAVTLGPRFAELEEGDWVVWTSDRHFGGVSKTFRIESYSLDEKWHITLSLREMASVVYARDSDLASTAVALDQDVPPPVGQPGVSAFALGFDYLTVGGLPVPTLVLTGAVDDDYAHQVRFETWRSDGVTNPATVTNWTSAGVTGPDVVRREISTVAVGATYYVAITYMVSGKPGLRRILGPVQAGWPEEEYNPSTSYSYGRTVTRPDGSRYVYISGTPGAGHTPPNATYWAQLTGPVSAASIGAASLSALAAIEALASAKSRIFWQATPPTPEESSEGDRWVNTALGNKEYRRVAGTGRLEIGGNAITLGGNYITLCWTPADDNRISAAIVAAAGAQATADGKIVTFRQYGAPTAEGVGDLWEELLANGTTTGLVKRWNGTAWVVTASLGAPAGTLVAGVEAAAFVTAVDQIASDSWLSSSEKPVYQDIYNKLLGDHVAAMAKATSLGVAAAQRTTATNAKNALDVHLTSLTPPWTDNATNTPIVRATFSGLFKDWGDSIAALIMELPKEGPPGAPGTPGAPGDDGVSPIAVTFIPSGWSLTLASGGSLNPGQLPAYLLPTATQAGASVPVTAVSIVSGSAVGGTFVVESGQVKLTAISSTDGHVDVDVTAAGQTVRQRLVLTVVQDGTNGGTETTIAITSPQINSGTYMVLGSELAINASDTGKVTVNLTGTYFADTFQAQTKLQVSTGGGIWTDVAGSEKIGTLAETISGDPGEPIRTAKGNVNIGGVGYLLTGYAAEQALLFRALGRKYGGDASATDWIKLRLFGERTL